LHYNSDRYAKSNGHLHSVTDSKIYTRRYGNVFSDTDKNSDRFLNVHPNSYLLTDPHKDRRRCSDVHANSDPDVPGDLYADTDVYPNPEKNGNPYLYSFTNRYMHSDKSRCSIVHVHSYTNLYAVSYLHAHADRGLEDLLG
jgi:hypothetical protein